MSTRKMEFFRVYFMENSAEKARFFDIFQHIVVKILADTSGWVWGVIDTRL